MSSLPTPEGDSCTSNAPSAMTREEFFAIPLSDRKDVVVALYESMTLTQISRLFGITRSTIVSYLEARSVPRRRGGVGPPGSHAKRIPHPSPPISEEMAAGMVAAYPKHTIVEIAAMYLVAPSAVRRVLVNGGVRIRRRGEPVTGYVRVIPVPVRQKVIKARRKGLSWDLSAVAGGLKHGATAHRILKQET